jgi:hypothetical protein
MGSSTNLSDTRHQELDHSTSSGVFAFRSATRYAPTAIQGLAERGFSLASENASANLYRTVTKQSFAIHFLPSVLRQESVSDGVGPRSLSRIFALF